MLVQLTRSRVFTAPCNAIRPEMAEAPVATRADRGFGENRCARISCVLSAHPDRLQHCRARLQTTVPHMHRLLYEHAPRTPTSTEELKQFEQLLTGEVAFHLSRLGVGGGDPALTAVLLVQAVEAQIHGAILDPLDGRTIDDCLEIVIEFWTRALTAQTT
ncbi:hypothetical protein [Nocardia tengchongensis]|uniref:hypothetical protein n=1 Tax=Nocardia tengchongensis TaxID=2055889 RepID=UPI0036B5BB4D